MIYLLDCGGATCHVRSVSPAPHNILSLNDVSDYFEGENDIEITELHPDKELTINFDGKKVSLKASEWDAVYTEKQGIIASSEY